MHRRAAYNLIHLPDADKAGFQPWQTEDYRSFSDADLFKRLQDVEISIPNLATFLEIAENFESPDDMAEKLAEGSDEVYLPLFELWRRHLPEKRCPSVFCDELDFQISHYEKGNLEKQEELIEIVDYLEQIFDDHVDEGADPQAIFRSFQEYLAHDLNQFLYEYTLNALESDNVEYAYDLLDGFYNYLTDPIWFDFLMGRIAVLQDPEKGVAYLDKLIDHVKTLDLAEEMLVYFAKERNHPLFCKLALHTLPLLQDEESFKEFLDMCALHFENLGLEEPKNHFDTLLKERKNIDPQTPLDQKEAALKTVKKMIHQEAKR